MRNIHIQFFHAKFYLTALLAFLLQTSFAQTNLITNGDFENGTTGWTVWSATMATTADAHGGSSALIVSNRKNPWDALARDVKALLVNGDSYTISAWIKIPSSAVNLRATLKITADGDPSYTNFFWTATPVIGIYHSYSETKTISWSGALKSADLYFETEGVDGVYSDYLIDDVQMVRFIPKVDIIQTGPGLKDIPSSMLVGGCATEASKNYFTNDAAKAQVLKDCNTVTVQCYPGWGRWDESKMHVYHVDDFTGKVKEMKKQNMTVTAHMLLGWDQYFPEWYKKGDFPADTLEAIMQSWLKAIITNEGNDTLVDIWNVVNEAISWDGKGGYWPLYNENFNDACEMQRMSFEPDASGLTGNQFVNAEHPVYIRKAFEYARTLTKKKLELRDSGFEFPGSAKYNAFYQLAVHLKKMNAPVDVIGFQTHIDIEGNYDWEGYTNNIKRYRALGYEVNIPEVDIGDAKLDWTEEKAELQKKQYYNLITAAIRGGASDFQTWGFIDNENGWRAGEYAFPYTQYFEEKPAYAGIREALTDMSSILFWEMDKSVNDTMPDVMKYNNYGILNNLSSPEFVAGFKSKALQFDGVDDFISSGELSATISGDLTFSCFVKTSSEKAAIIADIASNENSGLKIGMDAEGKIFLKAADAGLDANLTSTTSVNDGTWHFIAIQRDGVSYKLYVDGATPVATADGVAQSFNKLIVGANSNGSEAFEGVIDEVKLYNWVVEEASFTRSFAIKGPVKLSFVANKRRIKLTWTDQSSDEDGFIIERKTGDGNWEETGRVDRNIVSFVQDLELFSTAYSYRVMAFSKFGNSASTNVVVFTTPADPNTAIPTIDDGKAIQLFPNPVHNTFTLKTSGNVWMKIYDIQGKLMLEKNRCAASETFDVSGFLSGVYFLQTCNNEKISILKLVKH